MLIEGKRVLVRRDLDPRRAAISRPSREVGDEIGSDATAHPVGIHEQVFQLVDVSGDQGCGETEHVAIAVDCDTSPLRAHRRRRRRPRTPDAQRSRPDPPRSRVTTGGTHRSGHPYRRGPRHGSRTPSTQLARDRATAADRNSPTTKSSISRCAWRSISGSGARSKSCRSSSTPISRCDVPGSSLPELVAASAQNTRDERETQRRRGTELECSKRGCGQHWGSRR